MRIQKHRLVCLSACLLAVGLPSSAVAYDCQYAQQDIQRLQSEKKTVAERAIQGASAILPIGAALHLLAGDEEQSLNEIGTDDYNRSLDLQIQQIKATCNLP